MSVQRMLVVMESRVALSHEFELMPRLAPVLMVTDDRRTITLSLREGATFHDGSACTCITPLWLEYITRSSWVGRLVRCRGSHTRVHKASRHLDALNDDTVTSVPIERRLVNCPGASPGMRVVSHNIRSSDRFGQCLVWIGGS